MVSVSPTTHRGKSTKRTHSPRFLIPIPWGCGRGGLQRERIWTFWMRVLHTCHHRTQVQTWLRLAGRQVPAIYGPSGDVSWEEADPTYTPEAADRGPTPSDFHESW